MPDKIGQYNSQVGGSVWGGGIIVSGTLEGQMQQSFHFQTLPIRRVCVPNDFEHGKGEKVSETKTRGKAASLKASSLGNVLLVTTDPIAFGLKLGQEEGSFDDTTDYYLPEVVAASEDPETKRSKAYPGACPERGTSRRRMPNGCYCKRGNEIIFLGCLSKRKR